MSSVKCVCKNHVSFPCSVCKKVCHDNPIRSGQRSVQCDICELWTHQVCSGMTNYEFESISQSSITYNCPKCIFQNIPFYNISNSEIKSSSFNSSIAQQNFENIPFNKQYIETTDVEGSHGNTTCFMYVNIRSLNCNFQKLEELLVKINIKPTVICVTETWITPLNYFIHSLPGYNFVSKDSNSKCGGVALFIKEEYNYSLLNNYNLHVNNCEDIWVNLEIGKTQNIIIGNIYRHPGYKFDKFEENLINTLHLLLNNNKKFIFGGDLNINLKNNSPAISNFNQNILSLGCSQEIEVGTRFSNNFHSSTLLDHIQT